MAVVIWPAAHVLYTDGLCIGLAAHMHGLWKTDQHHTWHFRHVQSGHWILFCCCHSCACLSFVLSDPTVFSTWFRKERWFLLLSNRQVDTIQARTHDVVDSCSFVIHFDSLYKKITEFPYRCFHFGYSNVPNRSASETKLCRWVAYRFRMAVQVMLQTKLHAKRAPSPTPAVQLNLPDTKGVNEIVCHFFLSPPAASPLSNGVPPNLVALFWGHPAILGIVCRGIHDALAFRK